MSVLYKEEIANITGLRRLLIFHHNKVKELINRLAESAKQTDGTFTFRNGKLFGNFIIIVNKAQDRILKTGFNLKKF